MPRWCTNIPRTCRSSSAKVPVGRRRVPSRSVTYSVLIGETFSSAEGVGLNNIFNEALTGTIIASDPPHHQKLRNVLSDRLSPKALRALGPDITRRVSEHVDGLAARVDFDAVTDLAAVIPISIVLDLLGFPHEGRENLTEWGEETFNAVGPANRRMQDALPKMQEMSPGSPRPAPGTGCCRAGSHHDPRGGRPRRHPGGAVIPLMAATASRRWTRRSARWPPRSRCSPRTPSIAWICPISWRSAALPAAAWITGYRQRTSDSGH
jgi:hypothetical protein